MKELALKPTYWASVSGGIAIKQSNAKYNIQYIDNIVRTKYLKKLEVEDE